MTLSRQSLEILVDLVEIKVSLFQVQDRDDVREHSKIRKCRQELLLELDQLASKKKKKVIKLADLSAKKSRRPSYLAH